MLQKLKRIAIIAALTLIAGLAIWFWFFSPVGVSIRRSDDIATTKTYVTAMRDIGQWEFLAINDEELVDTVDKGFFSNRELIRIYYGTLRLGIDFSQCDESWISVDGDSITLDLPQVKLLDENFIDEAIFRNSEFRACSSNRFFYSFSAKFFHSYIFLCLSGFLWSAFPVDDELSNKGLSHR
jgi:hypothetical protein